jgi:hypothetical protein
MRRPVVKLALAHKHITMKKILWHSLSIIALAASFTLTGCFKNFYTVKTNTSYENLETTMAGKAKEVIVHYTDETVVLRSPEFDANQLTGTIIRYTPAKPQYAEPDKSKKLHQYKYAHRDVLFNEVHVYATVPKPDATKIAVIRKEQISRYNIYKPARGASIGSHLLGGIVIAVIIAGAAAAIGAATFSLDLGSMAMGF